MKIQSHMDFSRIELTKEEVKEVFRAYVQTLGYVAKGEVRISGIPDDSIINVEIEENGSKR